MVEADTGWAYALAVVMAVNSVIALAYYANVAKEMWMNPAPDGDEAPVRVPVSLSAALGHHRGAHAGVRGDRLGHRARRHGQLRRQRDA